MKKTEKHIKIIVEALTAAAVLVYLASYIPRLFYACPLNFVEFESTSFALLTAREGLGAYQPLFHDLTTVGYYGPLFYALPAAAGRALGLLSDPAAFLLLMRMVTFLFAVMSAALLAGLVSRLSGERLFGWLSAAVFLSSPWFLQGARPDFPAFVCVFLAAGLVLSGNRARSWVNIAAGLACAAAVLHLQRIGAFVPAYALVLIFFERRFAQAALFLFVFTASVLIPVWALNEATQGAFLKHTLEFLSLVSHPRPGAFEGWMNKPGRIFHVFAAVCLGVFFLLRKNRGFAFTLTGTYFLSAAALSLVTTRSVGASANHFLETLASALLLLAVSSRNYRGLRILLIFFLAAFFLRGGYGQAKVFLNPPYLKAMDSPCEAADGAFGRLPSGGPVLSDYCVLPYKSGQLESCVNISDWVERLASRGKYDPERIRLWIRQKDYAWISVTGHDVFKKLFMTDIEAHYQKSFNIGSTEIWLPQK